MRKITCNEMMNLALKWLELDLDFINKTIDDITGVSRWCYVSYLSQEELSYINDVFIHEYGKKDLRLDLYKAELKAYQKPLEKIEPDYTKYVVINTTYTRIK